MNPIFSVALLLVLWLVEVPERPQPRPAGSPETVATLTPAEAALGERLLPLEGAEFEAAYAQYIAAVLKSRQRAAELSSRAEEPAHSGPR